MPPTLMRPTIWLASVIRPWAAGPAVTASSRITRRPPAPAAKMPAVTPAVSVTVTYHE